MEGGWVKIWRKLIDSQIFQNAELLQLFMYCLLRASHKDSTWTWVSSGKGQVEVEIKKGQMVFGRIEASKALGQKPASVHRRLMKLQKFGMLSTKSSNKFTLVTICNWECYQSSEKDAEQDSEQQMSSRRAANEQQVSTFKNDKNVKKVKNKNICAVHWDSEKGWQGITDEHRKRWGEAYPACDIDQELAKMNCWLHANPKRAKKSLWEKFLTDWLGRTQERGGTRTSRPQKQKGFNHAINPEHAVSAI